LKIEKIKHYTAKGQAGIELTEARLVENIGLEGDCHAQGGDRQIALLFSENREQLLNQNEQGLCFLRFKENIFICGMAPDAFQPGKCLKIREAVLEITGETKHCHEECDRFVAGNPCTLAGLNLFARVQKGGIIRVGDEVELCGS
jgi:MOSC domain-containing protein YiiM